MYRRKQTETVVSQMQSFQDTATKLAQDISVPVKIAAERSIRIDLRIGAFHVHFLSTHNALISLKSRISK